MPPSVLGIPAEIREAFSGSQPIIQELGQPQISAMQNQPSASFIDWPDGYRMEIVFEPCQSERRFPFAEFNRFRANLQVGIRTSVRQQSKVRSV
jgi:hypothetical protein